MTRSLGLDVERHLTDMWSDIPELDGVSVTRGWPGTQGRPQQVFTTGVRSAQDWAALGAGSRDEAASVLFTVSVLVAGSHDAATDRVDEILALIEDSIRGSNTKITGGGLVLWWHLVSYERATGPDDKDANARRCTLRGEIAFKARI